jgi:hypothetical protein
MKTMMVKSSVFDPLSLQGKFAGIVGAERRSARTASVESLPLAAKRLGDDDAKRDVKSEGPNPQPLP